MRSPASHGLICRGIVVAGTPAIAAPGASYAVDFPRLLENDELLPPAATDSPAGKIDEHREEEKPGTKTTSRPRKRGSSSDVNCYCVVPLLEKAEGECISSLGLLHPLPLALRHHKLRLLLRIAAMLAWSA